jgi:hypothetical protein
MKKMIEFLRKKYPDLEELELMTDGSAAQFKNKFYFSNLMSSKELFGILMKANFYETHHGKSICDAIGGVLKRNVRARVLTGKFNVYNAKDFVQCSNSFVKKIEVWEVKQEDVMESRKIVADQWERAKTITGTRSFHYFAPSKEREGFLECAITSLGHGKVLRKA